jgi:CRISPR system Cascade subunit CasC
MLGTVEFNSATLYRYATLALHRLHANLGGDDAATASGAKLFIDAFSRAMPTGHQNTFAHRTLPHAVILTARTDQPVNLVGAYEQPVRGGSDGIVTESLTRLATELATTNSTWGNPPALTLATYNTPDTGADKLQTAFGTSFTFPDLLDRIHTSISQWLDNGNVA